MKSRSTWNDDSGAILVAGAFMALFLVGSLYHMIGVANVILQREGRPEG